MPNWIDNEEDEKQRNQMIKGKSKTKKNRQGACSDPTQKFRSPHKRKPKKRREKLTLEEIEIIKQSRKKGLANAEICELLKISYSTLAKWVKKLDLPKKYEGERQKNLTLIHSAIERLGCCSLKELADEIEVPLYTIDKYVNYLVRKREIRKIAISRGRKSKLTHRGTELFGESLGSVFFYKDRKEIISRLMETMSRSQEKGIKSALTHYLKSFGFTREEIDVINRGRSIPDGVINLQLKAEDIEKLSREGADPKFLINLSANASVQMVFV